MFRECFFSRLHTLSGGITTGRVYGVIISIYIAAQRKDKACSQGLIETIWTPGVMRVRVRCGRNNNHSSSG